MKWVMDVIVMHVNHLEWDRGRGGGAGGELKTLTYALNESLTMSFFHFVKFTFLLLR